MTLCPTCNGPLRHRHDDELGEELYRCRVCDTIGVEGVGMISKTNAMPRLKRLIKERDDERRRDKEALISPIQDPRWEQVF